jgi:plastocyanin
MTMRRKAALVAAVGLVLAVFPIVPAASSGGGGCGGPITNESGTEVAIDQFCFSPTVLYAEPGDTVTWTNRDGLPHNVAGANMAWGSFESFRRKRSVSYSFSSPGVYSYVCTMHPGMVGTVVVGEPSSGGMTPANSVRRIKHVSAVRPDPVVAPESPSDRAALWFGLSGALAVAGIFFLRRGLRRRLHA